MIDLALDGEGCGYREVVKFPFLSHCNNLKGNFFADSRDLILPENSEVEIRGMKCRSGFRRKGLAVGIHDFGLDCGTPWSGKLELGHLKVDGELSVFTEFGFTIF